MNRYLAASCTAITLASTIGICPPSVFSKEVPAGKGINCQDISSQVLRSHHLSRTDLLLARGENNEQQAERNAAAGAQRAAQPQARQAQQQNARAQGQQARQGQQQPERQAQQAQQQQARQAQEQNERQAQKAQEQAQRQQQRQQELEIKQQQQAQVQQMKEQERQQSQRVQQERLPVQQRNTEATGEPFRPGAGEPGRVPPQGPAQEGFRQNRNQEGFPGQPPVNPRQRAAMPGMPGNGSFRPRPTPPQLNVRSQVGLQKARLMPFINQNASFEEQQQARLEQRNLQAHMTALPINQAPPNYQQLPTEQTSNYFNNYQTYVNNQPLTINSQNTSFNPCPQGQWPSWWQPTPGWTYANGFTLGNLIRCGLNFLGLGWRPYYGPPPTGFVCAANYFPTPWIYSPYQASWIQPGATTFTEMGPDEGYTGPITVQVMEPVVAWIPQAYGGPPVQTTINQLVMYDAFYYPQFGRWGYVNRAGYFIWVNA